MAWGILQQQQKQEQILNAHSWKWYYNETSKLFII